MDPYHTMALNNAWANATVYRSIAGLSAQAFAAPRPGFFPSLLQTLNHIYEVDLYYLDALEDGGQGPAVWQRDAIDTPQALAAAQSEADMRLAMFCASLTQSALSARHATQRQDGAVEETTGALLLHLFQHQIHHRGQVHTQILHAGIAPPQLDDFHLTYGRAPSAQAYFAAPAGTARQEAPR